MHDHTFQIKVFTVITLVFALIATAQFVLA